MQRSHSFLLSPTSDRVRSGRVLTSLEQISFPASRGGRRRRRKAKGGSAARRRRAKDAPRQQWADPAVSDLSLSVLLQASALGGVVAGADMSASALEQSGRAFLHGEGGAGAGMEGGASSNTPGGGGSTTPQQQTAGEASSPPPSRGNQKKKKPADLSVTLARTLSHSNFWSVPSAKIENTLDALRTHSDPRIWTRRGKLAPFLRPLEVASPNHRARMRGGRQRRQLAQEEGGGERPARRARPSNRPVEVPRNT